jgi:hypothetical protein
MITMTILLLSTLPAEGDLLPTRMTFDEPRRFRRARASQDQELPRERPPGTDAARLREELDPREWSWSIAPTLRIITGRTRVREFDSKPEWLDLAEDLGLDVGAGVRLGLTYETRRVRWFLEVDVARSQGTGRFDRDFSFDEGRFAGGVPYRTHADMFFARAGMAFPGAIWERRDGRISPFLGLEYVRMSVGIDQPATGQSTSEQYEQFIPYPIAGVIVEVNLSDSMTLSGRLYGGLLPRVPTPYTEGGRMHMTVETIGLDLEISWQLTGALRVFGGAALQYWNGRLDSIEDDNQFRQATPMLRVGIEIGW